MSAPTITPLQIPPHEAWLMVIGQMKLQMAPSAFDAYIRDTRVLEYDGETYFIAVSSPQSRDWLASRMTKIIAGQLAPLAGQPVQVRFVYIEEGQGDEEDEPGVQASQVQGPGSPSRRPLIASSGAESARGLMASGGGVQQPGQNGGSAQPARPTLAAERVRDAAQPANRAQTPAGAGINGTGTGQRPGAALGRKSALTGLLVENALGPAAAREDNPHPAAQAARELHAARESFAAGGGAGASAVVVQAGEGELTSPLTGADSGEPCRSILIEEVAGTVEAALQQVGKIVAFPRYELRHIPLVGPEAFFLRLAFLQERFLHTTPAGRAVPFETSVESLLRWANVGRATLHRFKKGDPARGLQPAAGWFGIEQLPSAPRSGASQQQPPCRYRLQQGIPLTPMDAERLHALLLEAGIGADPLAALQTLINRPVNEILAYPPPAPAEGHKKRPPAFTTVASVVMAALSEHEISPELRPRLQEATRQLADHITMPHQMVHVSWYFLQEWLPLLGHDAAALVLYLRAQGFYNPQDQELRDEIQVTGGYSELARVIGLKRDRTIGDWLPNLFERQPSPVGEGAGEAEAGRAESDKWQREQQRQQQTQARIGRFVQVLPGSRRKMSGGHYAFRLQVEIKGEPLTPTDQTVSEWVYQTLAACERQGVLGHFYAWVTAPVIAQLAKMTDGEQVSQKAGVIGNDGVIRNDGAGTLGSADGAGGHSPDSKDGLLENDGWGILALQRASEMTARESPPLDSDGWGILGGILEDGAGILGGAKMTAGELFKGLLKLNTFWESIPQRMKTIHQQASDAAEAVAAKQVVGESLDLPSKSSELLNASPDLLDNACDLDIESDDLPDPAWDLRTICLRNGGMNAFRERIVKRESSAAPFLSWLIYAYSFKGRGVEDPVGWALTRLRDKPGVQAEGAFTRLAGRPQETFARLLYEHIESGAPPMDKDWRFAFHDATLPRLRALGETLGLVE